ncbi:MAG: glycerophosphodiester phosphodiesterase [Promethearchaeota archaeon]
MDWEAYTGPIVIAHRGANAEAPENTFKSFELAVEAGADFIEFDVHFSRDGELVVIHDAKVDRTTDGTGKVNDLTLAELRELDAGGGERIPTLGEVADRFGKKVCLQVEIKDSGVAKPLVELLKERDLLKRVLVSSFKHEELREVKRLEPEIETALLEPSGIGWATQWITTKIRPTLLPKKAVTAGATVTHPFNLVVTERMIRSAKALGVRVHPWTVDDPNRMKRFVRWGVNGLITNDPRTLKFVLADL